jgi:hypothetical protein
MRYARTQLICAFSLHWFCFNFSDNKIDSENEIDVPASLIPPMWLEQSVGGPNVRLLSRVFPLTKVRTAQALDVQPMTYEDWLALEDHATWLANGGLLQQISIVYPNQIISLQLPVESHSRSLTARVLVKECNFDPPKHVSFWNPPHIASDAADEVLRLVANTNVIVQPLSPPTGLATCSCRLWICPTKQEYSSTLRHVMQVNLESALKEIWQRVVSVSPFSVVVHPDTWQRVSITDSSSIFQENTQGRCTLPQDSPMEYALLSSQSAMTDPVDDVIQLVVAVTTSSLVPRDAIGKCQPRCIASELPSVKSTNHANSDVSSVRMLQDE